MDAGSQARQESNVANHVVHRRTVVLPAPPPDVWPWLVQMGDGRAGWYSLDALERLLGGRGSVDGWRSLRRIEPSLQDVSTGDGVPLGRGAHLDVVRCERPRRLTLRFDGDVGPGHLLFDWDFALRPAGTGTELVITTTIQGRPRPWGPALVRCLLGPGHRVMEAAQVRGLRRRVAGRRG